MANGSTAGRVYRANPGYRLLGLAELSPDERSALGDAGNDASVHGVLTPREGAHLTVKLVNEDTARLFRSLARGATVPGEPESQTLQLQLRDLVAAEILELEDRGTFRTGLDALPLLDEQRTEPDAGGALDRLSRDAIAYAEGLRLDNPAAIADRIYAYHRIAVGPSSRRRWSAEAVQAGIRAALRGAAGGERWRELGHPSTWASYGRVDAGPDADSLAPLHKLYVSPMPEELSDALVVTLDAIADRDGVVGWKVGSDCYGILRPDKLMVYMESAEVLSALGEELRSRLDGMPWHGVPFTAELGAEGLLSWGVDPPRFSTANAGLLPESWRTWLAGRLAGTLWQAARDGVEDALDLALLRLRAAGVDTDTWTPSHTLFAAAEGG